MHNPLTLLPSILQNSSSKASISSKSSSVERNLLQRIAPLMLGLSVWCSGTMLVPAQSRAQTAQAAPPAELTNWVEQMDAAASSSNLQAVMQLYGRNFTHSDGLTRSAMENVLKQFWQRYPNLDYDTEILSWEKQGNALVVETVTKISGENEVNGRQMKLNSTIRSRQRIEAQKIVNQEILAERTELTSGTNPPNVQVKLPEQVKAGQRYNFDAIVEEPLGNDLLLGAVSEEPVRANNYLNPSPVELDLLSAGGLFKQGVAPALADNRWISVVLIRGDGMTLVTQRLRVTQ